MSRLDSVRGPDVYEFYTCCLPLFFPKHSWRMFLDQDTLFIFLNMLSVVRLAFRPCTVTVCCSLPTLENNELICYLVVTNALAALSSGEPLCLTNLLREIQCEESIGFHAPNEVHLEGIWCYETPIKKTWSTVTLRENGSAGCILILAVSEKTQSELEKEAGAGEQSPCWEGWTPGW